MPDGGLRIGLPVPEFRLVDATRAPLGPPELRGTPALLVFVPFAFSGVCTSELQQLWSARGELGGARVIVASCDSPFALSAWTAAEDVEIEIASDYWPHGAAARALSAFDDEHGWALRRSLLLDAESVVRWTVLGEPGRARDLGEAVAAVRALEGEAADSLSW